MMTINLDDLLPLIRQLIPPLEEAQNEVNREADAEKRKDLIEKYRSRWVALRAHMAKLSNDKCWYTESKNPGTDDDVDHYRPKNSVAVEKSEAAHAGYYWLAFFWKNYRLSCHRGNRLRKHPETGETGGKGDRFPLLDPAKRLRTPTRKQEDLDAEGPLLLDPTRPGDEAVLTFTARGLVAISPAFESNPVDVKRFKESRKCYHLDWPAFREARVELYNLVERKVLRGNEIAPPSPSAPAVRSTEFEGIVLELRKLMDRDMCYSAAARAYVMSFRSYWWVELLVLRIVAVPSPAQGGGTTSGSPSN
jgi:hypothetical protein